LSKFQRIELKTYLIQAMVQNIGLSRQLLKLIAIRKNKKLTIISTRFAEHES
jgi:hypothetical protein